MAVTAAMVKDLREITGAGMMDCKKALNETNGDMDEAVEYLRKNGQAKAEKKAGRIAAEGLVKVIVKEDKIAAVVEVNSETDFVAKNEDFQAFVSAVAVQAVNSDSADIDAFMEESWNVDSSKSVKEALNDKIAVIGENLSIRRFEKVTAENGCVVSYLHGGGRIGVLVEAETSVVNDAVKEALVNVAMQVAALSPKYVSQAEVSEEYKEHEKEILLAQAKLENPEKPFVAILGGAKVSDKIGVIENLMQKVQTIEIGGAMANTFLKAKGYDIGSSKYEEDKIEVAKQIMKDALNKGVEIILPKDARVAKIAEGEELTPETVESAEHKNVKLNVEGKGESLEGWQILDVGDTTLTYFADRLENAKTVVWNGPLGYTEVPEFAQGTEKIAKYISHTKAKCVIGGGDSVAAIQKIKKAAKQNGEDVKQEFNNIYLSTGGGASLEFLEGKTLPGIAALNNKEKQKCKSGENGNCKSNEQQIAD